MIVVVDASAAIDMILMKNDSVNHKNIIESADLVIAPDIYISEIANTAWKYNKLAGFSHDQCVTLAEDSNMLIDQFVSTKELWKEALGESIKYAHTVYDFLYLITTRRNDGVFLSKDKKLLELAKKLRIKTK